MADCQSIMITFLFNVPVVNDLLKVDRKNQPGVIFYRFQNLFVFNLIKYSNHQLKLIFLPAMGHPTLDNQQWMRGLMSPGKHMAASCPGS